MGVVGFDIAVHGTVGSISAGCFRAVEWLMTRLLLWLCDFIVPIDILLVNTAA